MKEINIDASSTEATMAQLQHALGGTLNESCGEHTLQFDNEIGKGTIKCLTFDWGVSMMQFEGYFHEELFIVNHNEAFNPIHFTYCSKGQFAHRIADHGDYKFLMPYQSSIIAPAKGVKHYTFIPKLTEVILHDICVVRQEFFQKPLNHIIQLNKELYNLFMDMEGAKTYAFYGAFLLKIEHHLKAILTVESQGMARILKLEGEIFQILAMHIERHSCYDPSDGLPKGINNAHLKTVRFYADMIVHDPSDDYTLKFLAKESGLAQAKLQECFKFLYARTVTDFIRNSRLETAHTLMLTSDMNISQIVNSIGFSSRSYFSRIFREKYSINPQDYKKQSPRTLESVM